MTRSHSPAPDYAGLTYHQIKANLATARGQIDAGDIAGADATIRAMVGRGLTGADIDANLTADDRAKLRAHGRQCAAAQPDDARAAVGRGAAYAVGAVETCGGRR